MRGVRVPAGSGPEPWRERWCHLQKGKQGGRIGFRRETASSASDTSELPVSHRCRDGVKVGLRYMNLRLWREVRAADRGPEVASLSMAFKTL